MALKDDYSLELLVNEAERLVFEEMDKQLNKETAADACRCKDCILDIAALSLNSIKPHYRVSLLGRVYAHSIDEDKYIKAIAKSVSIAISKITDNPSHE